MKKRGVSLIELLIVMTLLGIMFTAFTSIYNNSIKTVREQMAQSQAQTEAQTILDRIQTEIKKGRTTDNTFGSYTLGSQVLIIQLPAINNYEDQNILYNGSNPILDRVIYYKSGNELHRKVIADPASARMNENNNDVILTNSISDLTFSYTKVNPTSTITIDVTTSLSIAKKVGKIYKTANVNGKASFRNTP